MDALGIIQSKLKAPKGQFNDFGKYKYRNCEDILEAVKPLLSETETILTMKDEIVLIGDRYYIKATVSLWNKENTIAVSAFAREAESKKGMDVSQITGAASSYARKYALNGLFCIDDTKDADSGKPEPEKSKPPESDKEELTPKQILYNKMKANGMTKEAMKKFSDFVGAKTDKEMQTFIDGFDAQYEAWQNEPQDFLDETPF